jgi:hypothetical protein
MMMETASTVKQENEPRLDKESSEKLRVLNEKIEEKKKLITEVDKRQKEKEELLVAKLKELESANCLLEEAKKGSLLEGEEKNTMFGVSKSLTGNNFQSPADGQQVLNFDDVKWEKAFTGLKSLCVPGLQSASLISTNAVNMDGVICFGLSRENLNEAVYSIVFMQVNKALKLTYVDLQQHLTNFALAACKGAFHIVGGEFVKPYGISGGSNLILSCVGQTKMESNYPPMKTASASPAVVTYKEQIVVVHGRGSKGEIEVLDTNSVNPVWVQLRVHFPSWETPSATIVGNTLVVWVGGLYCTSLESIVADNQQSGPPGIYSNPAPQIEAKALRLLTLQGQLLAVDCSSSQYGNSIYAYRSATGEWVNIDNRKQIALALATSETSLVLFSTTQQLYSLAGCRGSVSCPV